jgi:multidrug resistance efflux pump
LETDKPILTSDTITITQEVFVTKNIFSEHGNEIEEIISKKPRFIVLWGTVFLFFLLLLIAIVCWYIQYPDIVVARAKLNSVNAPKQVISRTDGKLIKITVKENDKVTEGQLLGYMESIANPQSVIQLHIQTDSIISLIEQNRTDEIIKYFPQSSSSFKRDREGALGELQLPYQSFVQGFVIFKDFLSSGFYLRKKKMLLTDMGNIEKLHGILAAQKALLEQDLSLSKETFKGNESLAQDKVISALDYRNEKSKFIAKQLSLPQSNSSIVANESQQNDKRKEIAELENQIVAQKNNFIQTIQTMKSQVLAWEYKYLLKAPVSGSLSFTGFFQENQEIKAGQILFNIQPGNTSYFIEMLIPQYNFGKIKKGQMVLLKFQAYPFEQYGSVIGKIDYINSTTTDSGYLAKVVLPHGLITNYNKPLQYSNGLFAQADIITENMRLLERFYYSISKQIKR